nr:MAG TPA: hypothetical protein [Caudoviricetes sp.]
MFFNYILYSSLFFLGRDCFGPLIRSFIKAIL